MYVSAQPDGSVQINRREAPPGGWEEFTVEDRGNSVVCLKSCHGKYLSAQREWHGAVEPRTRAKRRLGGAPDRALGRYRTKRICNNYSTYALVCNRRPSRKSEVNGNYEFMPGKHENRHFSTIAGHYQHTQNPEIFIAFQDCGTNHQRPEWNKWMIISKVGVLYARIPVERSVFPRVKAYGKMSKPGVIRVPQAASIRRQQSITRPTLRLKLNSNSTPTVPPRLLQMNLFRCWKPCLVNPSASNSTTPQTTMMLGSASIQRTHPIRITEGKTSDGNTSGTST